MKNINYQYNDICTACPDKYHCTDSCSILTSNSLDIDYKDTIDEILEAKRQRKLYYIESIEAIQNVKQKAICGMLFFGVKVSEIAQLLKIDRPNIYRLLEPLKYLLKDTGVK